MEKKKKKERAQRTGAPTQKIESQCLKRAVACLPSLKICLYMMACSK